jgi:hypothetical protein
MGKQVQFYMTHENEKSFLASISDLAPVRLLHRTFTEPGHMELESFGRVGLYEAGELAAQMGSQELREGYQRQYAAPNALELSKAGKLQLGPSAEPELSLEERKRILGLQ